MSFPLRFLLFLTPVLAACHQDSPAPPDKSATPAKAAAAPAPPAPQAKPKTDLALTLDARSVTANVPAPATIQGENGAFTIFSEKHRINVGIGRIMVDGEQLMTIPAETKKLHFALTDAGLLTVTRDDAPAEAKQLAEVPEP